MKTLSEFLVDFLIEAKDFDEEEWPKFRQDYIRDYNKGIEAYKKHLQNDSPKTVQWAMIEKNLISALEKMESHNHLNENHCDHRWVERLDGHEEQCGAAICDLCGKYGCWCAAKWYEMTDIEKKRFHNNGINGNEHRLEKKLKANKNGKNCLQPSTKQTSMGCVKCKSLLACKDRENHHCKECLFFSLKSQGNCEEPGYGTLANNNACDRFKLNVQFKEN